MHIRSYIKENFDTIQTIAIIATLIFTSIGLWFQHREIVNIEKSSQAQLSIQNRKLDASNEIASADYVLRVSDELNNSEYTRIINDIENNPSNYHILMHFSSSDIENYIGNFETLGDLARDKLVNPSMAYDEFGYDLEKAWCNIDVQQVINEDRKVDEILSGPNAFYNGFELLAEYSLRHDNKDCSAMGRE